MPEIAIDADINQTVSEAAEKFFKLYTKARNARVEIAKRLQIVEAEIGRLKLKKERIETAIAGRDEGAMDEFLAPKAKAPARDKKKTPRFYRCKAFCLVGRV